MESIRSNLHALLTYENRPVYVIPKWQRQYEWGTGKFEQVQVEQLWNDLWNNCWLNDRNHFCGILLFSPDHTHGNPENRWEIVDGQQRITTFFLLFIAIRDLCIERAIPLPEVVEAFTTQGSQECRLKLSSGFHDDRKIMNALLNGKAGELPKKTQENHRLIESYQFFKNRLINNLKGDEIVPFFDRISHKVDLLALVLQPGDDPRAIFETLNSRGKSVDYYDLIRNMVMQLGHDDPSLQTKAQNVWYLVSQIFDEDEIRDFLDIFAKRNAQQSSSGRTFDEIYYEVNEAIENKRISEWLDLFQRNAKNFGLLIHPPVDNGDIGLLFQEFIKLNIPSLHPFLLALMEEFEDPTLLKRLLSNIRSLVVRMLICYDRPKYRISSFAEQACQIFFSLNSHQKVERLLEVESLLERHWKEVDDETFRRSFAEKSVYGPGINLRRLRYYFEMLEHHLNPGPFFPAFGNNSSIEHIMPQTLTDEWRRATRIQDEQKLNALHAQLADTIGNLTVLLVPDNSQLKNLPYKIKRDIYLTPNQQLKELGIRSRSNVGNCELNLYFKNEDRWGFSNITERGRSLAEYAVKIWSKT